MRIALAIFIILAVYITPLYPVYAIDNLNSDRVRSLEEKVKKIGTSSSNLNKIKDEMQRFKQLASGSAIFDTLRNKLKLESDKKLANLIQIHASKEAFLQKKLSLFRDQQKANIVSRISKSLNEINKKITDEMSKNLTRMTDILTKAQQRLEKLPTTTQAKLDAQAAINSANSTIVNANASVSTQALKDYTVNIASESTAKNDLKVTRDKLFNDLKSTRDIVSNSREAVIHAIKLTLAVLKEASSSGTHE